MWSQHTSIATYDRKRKQTVIFQISYSLNVSFPIEQIGNLKSCVLVTTEFDSVCREKKICWSRLPNMCACKLSWGHIYPLNQTRWWQLVSIGTYDVQRTLMLIFKILYPSQMHQLEIFKKWCKMLKISDQSMLFCFSKFLQANLGTCMYIHKVRYVTENQMMCITCQNFGYCGF